MKAVVLSEYGDESKLELRDVPEPHAGDGELKVRVAATSINPVDIKIREGAFRPPGLKFPYIPGRDAAGEVVEVGPGVPIFKVGDRVLGLVSHAYAEYVVAPVQAWAWVPPHLDLKDAAALPLVGLTGAQLIEDGVHPKRDDRILVSGAVGGVGRTAVFVARSHGAIVIPGVRRTQLAEAAALKVEEPVALDVPGSIEALPELDALADTVGGELAAQLVKHVKRGGTVASVLGEPAGAKERGLQVRAILSHPDSKRLGELAQAMATGELVIPIRERFPLEKVRQAQRDIKSAGGKILLLP